jgi:hypothetical protein
MILYEYLLKLYGLRELIIKKKKNVDHDGSELEKIVVKVDDNTGEVKEDAIKKQKKFYEQKVIRLSINYAYRILIFCVLLFECILPIISSGMIKDVHYFLGSAFSYMFLSQFIFGIILYDNDEYEIILDKMEEYNIYIHIAYGITFIISLILSTVPVFANNYLPILYNLTDSNIPGQVSFTIYVIINRFYSYNIFFSNTIIFALLMYFHTMQIKTYKKSLESMVDDNLMDMKISSTIIEYTDIKGNYGDSVKHTNHIFASIVVFGIIGCYFTLIFVKTGYNSIYTYIDTVCSLSILLIYILTICIISSTVDKIKSLIDSPKFIAVFLNKSNFAFVHGDVYNDYEENNLGVSPLSSPLRRFDILKDSVASVKPSILNIPKKNKHIVMDNVEQTGNNSDKDKKLDFIKNITLRGMVITTENGISLDWIILYSKLSDPWERFMVCGFEINDSQLFQQLISMAISFLGLMEISKLIQ